MLQENEIDFYFQKNINNINERVYLTLVHPLTILIYFICNLTILIFLFQPIFLIISTISGISYYIIVKHKNLVKASPIFLIFIATFISIFNPIFNHNGNTAVFTFIGINITKEALLYGIFSGILFLSSSIWFLCLGAVFDSEKIIYIFGRKLPNITLLLCLIFRLIPQYIILFRELFQLNRFISKNRQNIKTQFLDALHTFSTATAICLENSIAISDSMKSRGYTLGKRTFFCIYKFNTIDLVIIIYSIFLSSIIFITYTLGYINTVYFPSFYIEKFTLTAGVSYLSYVLLSFMPVLLEILEDIRWLLLKSRI